MLYREAGQFKTSYAEDQQIFPIRQDRIAMLALLVVAFVVVPLIANQYWLSAILTPFLIFALAAMGLNILTGYAGQLSLGTAAFMAVGAFAAYNFVLRVPGMPILVAFVLAGVCAALVGIVFGLPSLRIKGFYLAVATLAAQFFVVWALTKFGWFSNYSTSGRDQRAEDRRSWATRSTRRSSKYLLTLSIVAVLGARGQEHGAKLDRARVDGGARHGRRGGGDRHPAACRPSSSRSRSARSTAASPARCTRSPTSAPSSRRASTSTCRSGSCSWSSSAASAASWDRSSARRSSCCCRSSSTRSPRCIEHGLGLQLPAGLMSNLELIVFGALIIFFLIVEPHGLARLWQIAKEKLRLWPFPH